MTLRKRLSHNLQFDFDYTYSHGIDNNSTRATRQRENFEPGVTTILCSAVDTHLCRGNSEYDATHAVSAYFVYDLPFGRGQACLFRELGWFARRSNQWMGISGIRHGAPGLALTVSDRRSPARPALPPSSDEFHRTEIRFGRKHPCRHLPNNNQVQFYKNPSAAIAAFIAGFGFADRHSRQFAGASTFRILDVSVSTRTSRCGTRAT